MSRGTPLAKALLMLKAELGMEQILSTGRSAVDTELLVLLDNTQTLLSDTHDWPFLRSSFDVSITAGTADANRYYDFPTTLSLERPVTAEALWSDRWHPVNYGIDSCHYNSMSSGDGGVTVVQSDPIAQWKWKDGDDTKFEIWPLPQSNTTLRFTGQLKLNALTNVTTDGPIQYDMLKELQLDDLLIVYFAAADKLARMKKSDSSMKLSKAQERLSFLKSSYPVKNTVFNLRGRDSEQPRRKLIKIGTA
jgi:hypothetical protein